MDMKTDGYPNPGLYKPIIFLMEPYTGRLATIVQRTEMGEALWPSNALSTNAVSYNVINCYDNSQWRWRQTTLFPV